MQARLGKQQGYQGRLADIAEEMVPNQELITAFAHKDAIIEQFLKLLTRNSVESAHNLYHRFLTLHARLVTSFMHW